MPVTTMSDRCDVASSAVWAEAGRAVSGRARIRPAGMNLRCNDFPCDDMIYCIETDMGTCRTAQGPFVPRVGLLRATRLGARLGHRHHSWSMRTLAFGEAVPRLMASRVEEEDDITLEPGVGHKTRRRRPRAVLQKADPERDADAVELCEIGTVAGNDAPPVVDLQDDFIHDTGKRIEAFWISVRAPVEQARDAQLVSRWEPPQKVLQEPLIAGQMTRSCVEVDLHAGDPVSGPPPAFERRKQLRLDLRRPCQRLDP